LSSEVIVEEGRVVPPDFFISYTQVDRAWAEWIAWQLESAGHSTMVQAWGFGPGSPWIRRMDEGSEAKQTIAVLSAAYLQSDYGRAEWETAFANDPTGEQRRLLPVRVEPFEPRGLLKTRVYLDLVGLSRQAARERLLEGIKPPVRPRQEPPFPGAQSSPSPVTGQEPRYPGLGSEITNLPARNRNFVGRADMLERLQSALERSNGVATRVEAIYGLGGVGKTQLALEYAHWHAAEYELIWWVPAQQTNTAAAALAALARQLGLPNKADQRELVGDLLEVLRRRESWLLIYDSAEAPEQIEPLLPLGGHGHVLITSRYPAWGRVADPLRLTALRRQESVAFLRRRVGGDDEQHASTIAELLGDLPLALEEAAAYIEETQTGLVDYLRLVREHAGELFSAPVSEGQHVATAWSISLDRVRVQAPAAAALLELCAFLAMDDIPRELPRQHHDGFPASLSRAVRDPVAYNQVLRALSRYSLITVTPSALSVHPMVQMVVRSRLAPAEQRRWADAAVGLLRRSFPDRSSDSAAWPTCQYLLPHVLVATAHVKRLGVAEEEADWLLDRASAYLRARGHSASGSRR
jgi:hypothetical protein